MTTDKVSKDARRVFEDIAKEAARNRAPVQPPVFIEGLDAAAPILRKQIAQASLTLARSHFVRLGRVTGYNLAGIITARYGAET